MLILNFGRHLWDFGVIFAVYTGKTVHVHILHGLGLASFKYDDKKLKLYILSIANLGVIPSSNLMQKREAPASFVGIKN